MALPTDSQGRKDSPVWSGFVVYFPDAIVAVAQLSKWCDRKHNPDKGPNEPPTWAKEKSTDEADAGMRHAMDPLLIGSSEYDDEDGFAHKVKKAWRAMAELQRFLLAGNPARAFEPGPGGIRIPLAGGFEPSIATGTAAIRQFEKSAPIDAVMAAIEKESGVIHIRAGGVDRLDICFACAGSPDLPHIPTCAKYRDPDVEVEVCPECRRIAGLHHANCSTNFQRNLQPPAQPETTLYQTPGHGEAYTKVSICSQCGADLEQGTHDPSCLSAAANP